jgi:hypothetical protein
MTDDAVDGRLAAGELVSVHRGVFQHAAAAQAPQGVLLGAVLGGGDDAVASHRSAQWLHGLRATPPRPEITVPATDKPLQRGTIVHRTNRLDAVDVCTVSGVRSTSIPRTLLDLGAVLSFEAVEAVVQDAIIRDLTAIPEVVALLDRVGGRGRRGTGPLRAIVRQSMPDEKLQSVLEHRLYELIGRAGLPTPELQHHVVLASGADVFLDAAWPRSKVACEADGRRWHSTKADFERWLIRDRALKELGWDVRYYGWTDVVERTLATIHELAALRALLT